MAIDLSHITAAVAKIESTVDSAITALQGIAQAIRDNAASQGAINDLANSLDAETAKLADAIATPPAPTPATGTAPAGSTPATPTTPPTTTPGA